MDTAARYEARGNAVKSGWMSPNEARAKEDYAPVEGGETPYLQEQNWPLRLLAGRELPARAPTPPAPVAAPPSSSSSEPSEAQRALADRFVRGLKWAA